MIIGEKYKPQPGIKRLTGTVMHQTDISPKPELKTAALNVEHAHQHIPELGIS